MYGSRPTLTGDRLFRTALDYWCRADYASGMQATYAIIGMVSARWGDDLRNNWLADRARTHYGHAVEWLERCLDFSAQSLVGEDTGEAKGVLGKIHIDLGDFDCE